MDRLHKLETFANELAVAVKSLGAHYRNGESEESREVQRARRAIMGNAARIQTLLGEPSDFLQRLASQNQILACLQWLGEFQVLACIPLSGTVSARDVAELAGVPVKQLSRVVRMTSTAGFLGEPEPGQIAHTSLSAEFVKNLSYFDAAMFLAQTAAPTALKMATATRRYGCSDLPQESAYGLAFGTAHSFQATCEQRPKLHRQLSAYLQHAGNVDQDVTELLTRLDWPSLGKTRVVEVGAESTRTAIALAELHPALHFIVQMHGPDLEARRPLTTRLTIQKRDPGTPQTVSDAAVYILRLPSPSIGPSSYSLPAQVKSELRAHLGVLRNTNATLVLTPRLLPEPGTADPDVEVVSRVRDLSLLQLANDSGMIEMAELVEMVESIRDSFGGLVIVNKLRSRKSGMAALGVKYQASASHEALMGSR